MSVIEEVRREREDLARVLKRHTGIRRIVEDLYPDSAHFIYELLQNAEDTGADEVVFTLSNTGLVFEHNGRPFDRRDIEAITDIGEGTKAADDDKIGRFGVGFKAVFAYSETPHIWSPKFSFKITDLVLPSPLEPILELGERTRFEFPFNNPKKKPEKAYAEIKAGLDEIAETTLLFLSHLRSIRWQVDQSAFAEVQRLQHGANHFEVLKQSRGQISTSSHFLKFERPVEGLEKQRVAVAFPLDFLPNVNRLDIAIPFDRQMRVVAAAPGRVAVFFPAEKETSGLRFHLHAPFVPELSRASIKETPANEPLFQQLATLTAASLHQIRDLGLLTTDFLAVLPNPQDQVPSRYEVITAAIVDGMNNESLTPTYSKGFAPAKQLLQAKAALKDLLSEQDIKFLVEDAKAHAQWAVGAAQKNSNADRFLSGLDITECDVDEFVDILVAHGSVGARYVRGGFVMGPDEAFTAWLREKPADWHQRLYSFLYTELNPANDCVRFKGAQIVRLSNGSYSIGSACFFPSEGNEHDQLLPRVDANAYSSGRSKMQRDTAKKFLAEIGVREVGEAEEVEAILKQRYTAAVFKPRKQDLRRFIALVEKDPTKAKLFADYYVFEGQDNKWRKPGSVFLDTPFFDTSLTAYYDAIGKKAERIALADGYVDCGVPMKRLREFAEAVGVQTRLEVARVGCVSNPQYSYLRAVGGERYTSPIDCDYAIVGFEGLLRNWSLELARLIWCTMAALPSQPNYLQATYRKNESWGARNADSQLLHQLRKAAWIPQGTAGVFVRPKDASRDLLPEGFPFDAGSTWLKVIGFGQEVAKKSEEQRNREAVAREFGFADHASLERAKRFAAFSPEEQERILADRERTPSVDLPERESANPERRADRVGTKAADAPDRRTEERTRSISVGRDEVKHEAGHYLSQQYTNADGEMICQLCKGALPFKLDNGTEYFEKVEFLLELKKRHHQNYLALCPNHAAMFQYANGSRDSIKAAFAELVGNDLQVVLAQQETTIYFTKTHIADLRAVIKVDAAHIDGSRADEGRATSHAAGT